MYCNVIVAATQSNGNLLAVKRQEVENGDPKLPAGKMVFGESPIETAVRVLKDEAGITTDTSNFSITHQFTYNGELTLIYYVPAKTLRGVLTNGPTKVIDWMNHDTLMKGAFGKVNREVCMCV